MKRARPGRDGCAIRGECVGVVVFDVAATTTTPRRTAVSSTSRRPLPAAGLEVSATTLRLIMSARATNTSMRAELTRRRWFAVGTPVQRQSLRRLVGPGWCTQHKFLNFRRIVPQSTFHGCRRRHQHYNCPGMSCRDAVASSALLDNRPGHRRARLAPTAHLPRAPSTAQVARGSKGRRRQRLFGCRESPERHISPGPRPYPHVQALAATQLAARSRRSAE
jgi:hypothetical protein